MLLYPHGLRFTSNPDTSEQQTRSPLAYGSSPLSPQTQHFQDGTHHLLLRFPLLGEGAAPSLWLTVWVSTCLQAHVLYPPKPSCHSDWVRNGHVTQGGPVRNKGKAQGILGKKSFTLWRKPVEQPALFLLPHDVGGMSRPAVAFCQQVGSQPEIDANMVERHQGYF